MLVKYNQGYALRVDSIDLFGSESRLSREGHEDTRIGGCPDSRPNPAQSACASHARLCIIPPL